MFSQVMVGSNDIERTKRFYDALLGVLVAGEPMRNQNSTGQMRLFYRHDGGTFCVSEPIDGESATFANGGTVGFKCNSPEQVQQFHETAVAHGGTSIEEPPGLPPTGTTAVDGHLQTATDHPIVTNSQHFIRSRDLSAR